MPEKDNKNDSLFGKCKCKNIANKNFFIGKVFNDLKKIISKLK